MTNVILWIWLSACVACAVLVAVDVIRHPPKMWIMGIVWPVTALWAGPLGAAAYLRLGRARTEDPPLGVAAAKATTHCGAGCTLGDIVAAAITIAAPFSLAGYAIFGDWLVSLPAAFAFGLVFQYFTIAPMRHLGLKRGIVAAVKADSLSLLAWQVGMYGWMAIARFAILGHPYDKTTSVFWVMMQIAMLVGFATSYPVNVWLVRAGLKERM